MLKNIHLDLQYVLYLNFKTHYSANFFFLGVNVYGESKNY